mmetsp:Transcript_2993/g.3460  ORF Transcript_2993/g.3460 Transcript_2993/m.3460 type:complete len:1148 (+) Transcript_2993:143-3586(+)
MFAEELSGNASKKRAAAARARRKQLKEEQARKAKQKQQSSSTTTVATPVVTTAPSTTTTTASSNNDTVKEALEQRKIRTQSKLRLSSILTIQSLVRTTLSNSKLYLAECTILDKRLSDLSTLYGILKQQEKEYVCPPSLVSALTTQLLFILYFSKRGKSKEPKLSRENVQRLEKILTLVIIPGLQPSSQHIHPLETWIQSSHGTLRLQRLLQACFELYTLPHSYYAKNEIQTVTSFLHSVLLPLHSSEVTTFCKTLVLGQNEFNLILLLRRVLVKYTGTSSDSYLPPNAEDLREKSISTKDKERATLLWNLVLSVIDSTPHKEVYYAQMVKDIFTIPLLTWKIPLTSLVSSSSPKFLSMISSFASQNATLLERGEIVQVVEQYDVPITVCPAPPILCLTANVVQMGRFCGCVGGTAGEFDFSAATIYFSFLSILLDVIPLGTFSSRQNAVEWVPSHTTPSTNDSTQKQPTSSAHYAPIVLSPIILDQCRILLLDSYIRQLFSTAIMPSSDINKILITKNEVDVKHEKDLQGVGGSSASALAAKEAMVDRSKSFWQRSAWAKQISKKVSSLLSGDASSKSSDTTATTEKKGGGKLMNTSSISRSLAHGKGGYNSITTKTMLDKLSFASSDNTKQSAVSSYNVQFLFALCRSYSVILARWGGGGKEDIVNRVSPSSKRSSGGGGDASSKPEPCVLSLLNVICFGTNIVPALWSIIQSDPRVYGDLYGVIDSEKRDLPIRSLHCRPRCNNKNGDNGNIGAILLFMFVSCLSHILIITDDVEIFDMDKPLPMHQIRRCILLLKKLLYRACCVDDTKRLIPSSTDGNEEPSGATTTTSSRQLESHSFGLALITASSKTMRDLYDRSSRRPLCVPKLWLVEDLLEKDLRRCKEFQDYTSLLTNTPVLRVCPYLVSFKRRLKLFERIVTTNRTLTQGSNDTHNLRPGVMVRIMRGRVLEDGLIHLNNLGRNMRQRIVVQYISEAGTRESGVDVGGLFKEFWTDLSNIAFDPNYALFRATEGSGNCLYPNPSSRAAHGSDNVILFEFLGRILGKALYEGITIQPQFSHFFLSFLRGDYNFLHMLPDLHTMDPQLYNNLMFLKTYEGDAADLCLTFTIANDDFGGNKEVPLIPNGADVEVTNLNKQRYIGGCLVVK